MFGPIEIPNKSSFKINEVCALTGVKSYVLRFWESEFPEIGPMTSSVGQKLYEHRDIESILLIKKLLFEDKMTIEKAKAEMKILMPREPLVESPFFESESINEDSKISHKLEHEFLENTYHSKSIDLYDTFSTRDVMTKRVLIESDIQKLNFAKNKLSEILILTKTLQEKNNWI